MSQKKLGWEEQKVGKVSGPKKRTAKGMFCS